VDEGIQMSPPGVEGVALFLVVGVAIVNLRHAGTLRLEALTANLTATAMDAGGHGASGWMVDEQKPKEI
jgi:hypothetical protein